MCRWMQRPEEVIEFPGAGATGDCKPSDVGARNQISVLCKSRKLS